MADAATLKIPHRQGPMTGAEAMQWTKAQLRQKNYAKDEAIAERVIDYVDRTLVEWRQRMITLHNRWRFIYYLLSGNTLSRGLPDEIGTPELYKQLETMVPRIEEALLDFDPWFRVAGRDRMDERRADAIAAFLDWELDQAKWRKWVQPGIRDMLITQVSAIKWWWQRESKMVTRREVETEYDNKGNASYRIKIKEEDLVTYEGPMGRLVDPFKFIMDHKSIDPQDAKYVGDKSDWYRSDLKRFAKLGFLENVDKIPETPTERDSLQTDYYAWGRSPTNRYGLDRDYTQRADRPIEVVELWTRFDLFDDGEEHECVLAVAEGKVCLRASLNFYDEQFRPYAIARVNHNGHELYSVGPLDNGVRLQLEADRIHTAIDRAVELSVNPMVFAEADSDLPDSIYGIRPGRVWKGVGRVDFTKMPDPGQAPLIVLNDLRRTIEEVVGAPRILQGNDMSNTATQALTNQQEANRRLKSYTRSYSDKWEQSLSIMHKMNGQFLTAKTSFRVLGKRAKALKKEYLEIGPDSLMEAVDFEFKGIANLSTYGMRATALQNVLQLALPIIQTSPDIDGVAIVKELLRLTVGPEYLDRIVRERTPPELLMTQDEENFMLLSGDRVPVDPDDQHEDHLRVMIQSGLLDKAANKKTAERIRDAILEHAALHRQAVDRQRQADQVNQRRSQQENLYLPPEAGGVAGEGGRQSPAAGGLSSALMPENQNPGPADSRKMSVAGRDRGPVAQTNNQL